MTQHIEEARKLAYDYAYRHLEDDAEKAIAAAIAAAEERGRSEERERIRLDAVEKIREWMYARTGIRITYRTAQTFAAAITKEPTP